MKLKLSSISTVLVFVGLFIGLIITTIILSTNTDNLLLPETQRASKDLIDNSQKQLLLTVDHINQKMQTFVTQKKIQLDLENNATTAFYKSLINLHSSYFPVAAQLVQLSTSGIEGVEGTEYLFQPTEENILHIKYIQKQLKDTHYQIIRSTLGTIDTVLIVFSGKITNYSSFNQLANLRVVFNIGNNSPLLNTILNNSNSDCLMLAMDGKLLTNASSGPAECQEALLKTVNMIKSKGQGIDLSKPTLTFSARNEYLIASKQITGDSNLENIHLVVAKQTRLFESQQQLIIKIIIAVAIALILSALITSFVSTKIIRAAVKRLIDHVQEGISNKKSTGIDEAVLNIEEFMTITAAYDEVRAKLADEATERIKAETDQIRLKRKLQTAQAQKMESLGTFTAGVAHDFNNILAIIKSNLELIELSKSEPAILEDSLKSISIASNRATSMIADLMLYVRNDKELQDECNIINIVKSVAELIPPMIKNNAIEFNLHIGYTSPFIVRVNRNKLTVALLNLISNAKDATPETGTIKLSLRSISVAKIKSQFQLDVRKEYCLLEVADTGTGIDKQIRDKIFEPFFTTKAIGKGTGMGLSIVYECVRESGGYIQAIPNPGGGTKFQLLFPQYND